MNVADWNRTWQSVAEAIALRSRCVRRQVGCVIVTSANRVVAVGYNGAPAGLNVPGACTAWCERAENENPSPGYMDCLTIHAEANALLVCDRRDREGGTLYTTSPICFTCAKLIANSGLAAVHYRDEPHGEYRATDRGIDLMRRSGLKVVRWTT